MSVCVISVTIPGSCEGSSVVEYAPPLTTNVELFDIVSCTPKSPIRSKENVELPVSLDW